MILLLIRKLFSLIVVTCNKVKNGIQNIKGLKLKVFLEPAHLIKKLETRQKTFSVFPQININYERYFFIWQSQVTFKNGMCMWLQRDSAGTQRFCISFPRFLQ